MMPSPAVLNLWLRAHKDRPPKYALQVALKMEISGFDSGWSACEMTRIDAEAETCCLVHGNLYSTCPNTKHRKVADLDPSVLEGVQPRRYWRNSNAIWE